jgi:hypothetical protein
MPFQLVGHPLLETHARRHGQISIISLEHFVKHGLPSTPDVVISCMAPDRGTEIFGDYVNFDGFVAGPYISDLAQRLQLALMQGQRRIYVILPQRHPVSFQWQHKNLTYIELPEFYGTYWDFYHHEQPLHDYDAWNLDQVNKHYMCLAKRVWAPRFAMFHDLVRNDLLDRGHVSFLCERTDASCSRYSAVDSYRQLITEFDPTHFAWIHDLADRVEAMLPYQSTAKLEITDYFCESGGWITDSSLFASSFVNVIVETYLETPGNPVFTEKTFKTIYHQRPFFLLGSPNSLRELRNLGFQTFDRWFDESYDWGNDPTQRALKISSQIRSICELPLPQIRIMLEDMRPVIEHNYNRLAELRLELGQQVDRIDRFILDTVDKYQKKP